MSTLTQASIDAFFMHEGDLGEHGSEKRVKERKTSTVENNKAVYTTAPVADGWAGAVMIRAGAVMVWAGAVMIWAGQ